jgi:hypothetical protein
MLLRTDGSQLRLIPQPEGAQFAPLAPSGALLLAPRPNTEIAFFVELLSHSGQRIWRARLAERISFSNLWPQSAHMYSKIGTL